MYIKYIHPLALDGFKLVENFDLQPCIEVLKHEITAEELPQVLLTIYRDLSGCSRTFSRQIGASHIEYYAAIVFNRRLAEIRCKKGIATIEDQRQLALLEPIKLHVPAILADWLNGLGNISSDDQGEIELLTRQRLNNLEHYGKIDAHIYQNHQC